MNKWHWLWFWSITDELVRVSQPELIEQWKSEDPSCKRIAWYNVLMYFSVSRATLLGFTANIRQPREKECTICGTRFTEDTIPVPLVERMGIDGLDYCKHCLQEAIYETGDDKLEKESILDYARRLAEIVGRVPHQGYGRGKGDFVDIDPERRTSLLRLLQGKPSERRIKRVFKSWLKVLIEAGILQEGTRRTARGIQTISRDGHVCLSLAEKTIDDWLCLNNIPHVKEPRYPKGNYRADFQVKETLIEYFGLMGDGNYESRVSEKIRICTEHGIDLIPLYPVDLAAAKGLEVKLGRLRSCAEPIFGVDS